MKFCPSCKAEYSNSKSVCKQDNILLSLRDTTKRSAMSGTKSQDNILLSLRDPYSLVGDDARNLIDWQYTSSIESLP